MMDILDLLWQVARGIIVLVAIVAFCLGTFLALGALVEVVPPRERNLQGAVAATGVAVAMFTAGLALLAWVAP